MHDNAANPALSSSSAPAVAMIATPCDEELIRIPGSIQQHGFLLLTEPGCETVLLASANTAAYLGIPLRLLLNSRLDTFLERELLQSLRLLHFQSPSDSADMVTYIGSFRLKGELFSVTTHAIGEHRALEFELQERLVGPEMMNSVITNFVSTLSRLRDTAELCESLTRQFAELTGFDRVLLYSFNEEGHGTVLAESNNGLLPSYLGLRFPATDIPRQARELYVLSTVRIIPDANYDPSPLMAPGTAPGGTPAPHLDLSLSVLRSVSPVHLEYMRNMGTLASMSVSILTEGRLWGLISCHNATPRLVPYLVRSACDMLTRMAGTQLLSFETAARLQQTLHYHAVQRNILTAMAAEPNYLNALVRELPNLLRIVDASGVALLVDGHFSQHGDLPDSPDLEAIGEWLHEQPDVDPLVTSHLSAHLPWADRIRKHASGLLAIRISSVGRRYLLWFRPELLETVRWAGDPMKAETRAEHLTPRTSFDEWKETVQGHSDPWTAMEIDSAHEFRTALTTIGLRRAEEAVELGEARFQQLTLALPIKIFTADDAGRLTYVNDRWHTQGLHGSGKWFEEASFHPEDAARATAHWSQAVATGHPFEVEVRLLEADGHERWNFVRVVPFQRAGAARAGWVGTFIDLTESKERETALRMSEKLALTGRMTSVIAHEINNPLEAITNLMYLLRSELPGEGPAGSYIAMVESELERISGITKQTLRWNRENSDRQETFSLSTIVADVLRLFAGKIRNRQITVRTEGVPDLTIVGILGQIRQVLANLVSNAIDAAPVNGRVTLTLLASAGEHGLSVADNGRGIEPANVSRLFEPFYSTKGDLGNGLGLYISKEIVERHHGRIHVDSIPEQGTTMTVWLPADPTRAADAASASA